MIRDAQLLSMVDRRRVSVELAFRNLLPAMYRRPFHGTSLTRMVRLGRFALQVAQLKQLSCY